MDQGSGFSMIFTLSIMSRFVGRTIESAKTDGRDDIGWPHFFDRSVRAAEACSMEKAGLPA
jgi:hypothetical protein